MHGTHSKTQWRFHYGMIGHRFIYQAMTNNDSQHTLKSIKSIKKDPTSYLIYYHSKDFPHEFMVSIMSLKSNPALDNKAFYMLSGLATY